MLIFANDVSHMRRNSPKPDLNVSKSSKNLNTSYVKINANNKFEPKMNTIEY